MIASSTRFGIASPLRRSRAIVWAAAAAVLTVLALSQPAAAMQLTPLQKQEMKLHYEKATRAYDVQKYSEAVDEYQKAYEIGGDPAMLYNVAQSFRLNDQLPEALRFYRRYLQRSPNARNREDVERKIADLEKTVEERRKAAVAAAPPPVVAPPVVVAPPSAVEPEAKTSEGSGLRTAGIVVAAVGAAALVTAAITGKMASDKGEQLTNASVNGDTFDPKWESSGKMLDTVTIVSAIAGGAAVVTGVVLMVVSGGGSTEEQRVAVAPAVGAGLFGASAAVRF